MQDARYIKRDSVVVPIKEWEGLQEEIARLRARLEKARVLKEVESSIRSIQADVRAGRKPRGKDARDFVAELLNEE